MHKKNFLPTSLKCVAPLLLLLASQAKSQDAATSYAKMAPIDQYLMPDRAAEIALARTAAPDSITP